MPLPRNYPKLQPCLTDNFLIKYCMYEHILHIFTAIKNASEYILAFLPMFVNRFCSDNFFPDLIEQLSFKKPLSQR